MSRVLVLFIAILGLTFANYTCPNGTVKGPNTNMCFKFVSTPSTWLEAQINCAKMGGNLVTVGDAYSNSFLVKMAINNSISTGSLWVGGTSLFKGTGNWSWADGSSWYYSNWATGRPRNIDSYDAIELYVSSGRWYDMSKSALLPYVCEIWPDPRQLPSCQDASWVYLSITNQCYKVTLMLAKLNFDFQVLTTTDTWLNQRQNCLSLGSDLVSIHSKVENVLVGGKIY